jgi:hypothetical protein
MKRVSVVPVSALAFLLGALPGLAVLGGCDGSKAELAATQLERDQLKAQLVTLQGTLDGMKKDLDTAKTQAAKCEGAAGGTAAAGAPAAGKAAPAAPAAPAGKAAPAAAPAKKGGAH